MHQHFFINDQELLLRLATFEDIDLQRYLYADTRSDEMALVDWSDDQKKSFLHQQFEAQTNHYQNYYSNAVTQIILLDQKPIGRFIRWDTQDYILIIDIALLFEYRNMGIGTILIKDLMNDANSLNLPIILRVEIFNHAINLYERLGFKKSRLLEVYQEMVWTPPQSVFNKKNN
ncbi:MAG: GNAT family N-acetyltransferase [Chloroflexi bacterium HGW-Chloroflexi-3]|nr:MAG: GNAT family N-acetyltransferase [Chloroflexi bacterium HGW-Chloroflexi-3]